MLNAQTVPLSKDTQGCGKGSDNTTRGWRNSFASRHNAIAWFAAIDVHKAIDT
jgi:hypothetical protein